MQIIRSLALLIGLACVSPASGQTAPTPRPPACATPEHRQFDFWVGRWDVYPRGTNQLIAHSLIENLYGGCAIRENWMPLKGTGGGSLNSYDPAKKQWRQTWVDSANAHVDFSGGLQNGVMVITGHWGSGPASLTRMSYSREADGAVRQFGETSADEGKTWKPSFDFLYRPAKP
jgi:hypothetical protein